MEIANAESFLAYLEKVRERTLRVAKHNPPERLEWSYREGMGQSDAGRLLFVVYTRCAMNGCG